ncbi:MAG: hypothetical protein DRP85_09245 [Candidatus Makaraimicrobium thalassicum]|nr:MAG: hypothetical protein DRP85_09245 [Candidatus Omnitrophota bacterium]
MSEKLIKTKIALDRGKYWMSYLNYFILIFIATSSIKDYPQLSFLQGRYWLILLLFLSLISIAVLGYLDLKVFSTYQKEVEIMSRINPLQQKLLGNQKEILERLEHLETKHSQK